MKIILYLIAFGLSIGTYAQNNVTDSLTGTWFQVNNMKEIILFFSPNGSYKIINKNLNDTIYPIRVGKWTISMDTIKMSNMDALDKKGQSIYTDPNVLYVKNISLKFSLRNDSLILYEKANNTETENIFTKRK